MTEFLLESMIYKSKLWLSIALSMLMGFTASLATAAVDCQQSGVAYADVPESLDLALITMQQDQVVLCTPLSPRPEFVLAGGKAGLIEAILGNVTIEGEIIENQTLTARLDINRGAIRALRVKTRLAWLRDGAPITDTDLSRYTVQENDIGSRLAVRIDLIDMKGRILHSRRSDETQLVMMMEHPPVITDLAVAGEGKSGESLVLSYVFRDKNPEDSEEGTSVIWLRDNLEVSDAEGFHYHLDDDDVGAEIAAMVTPRSNDGVTGEPVVINFDGMIAPVMVEATPDENEPPEATPPLLAEVATPDENEPPEATPPLLAEVTPPDENEPLEAPLPLLAEATPDENEPPEAPLPEAISLQTDSQIADLPADQIQDSDVAEDTLDEIIIASVPEPEIIPQIIPEAASEAGDIPQEEIVPAESLDTDGDEAPVEIASLPPVDVAPVIDGSSDTIILPLEEEEWPLDNQRPLLRYSTPQSVDPADTEILVLAEGLGLAVNQSQILRRINFSESQILDDNALSAIDKKYFKQPIDLVLIRSIIDDTNALYMKAGYALSRALLPEQTIFNGVLDIQLVEAKVGNLVVENSQDVKESYIRNRLGLKSGDILKLSALEHSIRLYNANNKSQLTSELAPGAGFGETDVFVNVDEPDFVELPSVSMNNHGSELSDWRQNSFTTVFNNLLGYDDEFSYSFSDADGSSTNSIQYSFPFNRFGTNVTLARSVTKTKVNNGSNMTVGYRGTSRSTSLSISRPLVFKDRYSIYLSAAMAHGYGDLVQPSSGTTLSRSHTRKWTMSLPMSWSDGVTTVSFSPTYSLINSVTEIPRRENWMGKIEGNVAVSRFITSYLTGNMRGKFLYAEHENFINLPSEILSVGGPGSVRAYQPGEDSGYQGYLLSAELRTDVANWGWKELPGYLPSVQPYVFVDHMFAQQQFGIRYRGDFWSGYGVGLTIPVIADIFTFDSYYAKPLDNAAHAAEKAAYNDNVLKFALSAKITLN